MRSTLSEVSRRQQGVKPNDATSPAQRFVEVPEDAIEWLHDLCLPGARVVQVAAPVPITSPGAFTTATLPGMKVDGGSLEGAWRLVHPGRRYCAVALEGADRLKYGKAADRIADVLERSAIQRADGLPGFNPWADSDPESFSGLKGTERLVVGLLQAVAHDLSPENLREQRRAAWSTDAPSDPYKPLRARMAEGRKMLHALGVWPWTHAAAGKLPADWRHERAFLEPLGPWWAEGCRDYRSRVQRSIAARQRAAAMAD